MAGPALRRDTTSRHQGSCLRGDGTGEELGQLGEVRPVHRIDRIAVIGVAERDRDKDEPARWQKIETMLRQPLGFEHMLQQVAAEDRLRSKRTQTEHVGSIGQIRLDIDTQQLAAIDMDDFDLAVTQRAKHLAFDPWLHGFPDRGRTAAEIERGRQALRRERIERAAEPASLGFEHRGLRSLRKAPRCLNLASLRKCDAC